MSSWREKTRWKITNNFQHTHCANELFIKVCFGFVSTHHFNELKELYDGRVEEVVSGAVVQQGINDRLKQVPFDDVAVVVLILQTNDSAHETQGTLDKNRPQIRKREAVCFSKCVH